MAGKPVPLIDRISLGYRQCARLTWRHGTTYYWGAAILPRAQRRHVHAVYALCRLADDIVDTGDQDATSRAYALQNFHDRFRSAVDHGTSDPVLAAVADTVHRRRIPMECFDRFFAAMALDLVKSRYATWADLCDYTEGSAAVIGEMMLPILQPRSAEAFEPARSLGLAFQLTNFLRDVGEDLDRGRVYLPQEDLVRFDADPALRRVTPQWRQLMQFEIDRNRRLYEHAAAGLACLPPASARCVGTAQVLYAAILDRIVAADYDVFSRRAAVPTAVKAATAARRLLPSPHRNRQPEKS